MPNSQTKKPRSSPGPRLARQRRRNKLTRQDVAARLGLNQVDVKNIENDRLDLLPTTLNPKDVVRHYALLLGENPSNYRAKTEPITSRRPGSRPLVSLSKTSTSLLLGLVLVVVASFVIWRIILALALPVLEVSQPAHGMSTAEPAVSVSGVSSEQAQVFVNDSSVPLNPDGSFSTQVILAPGLNDIRITAINSFGREANQNRTVIYRPQ